jgi:hypothetical protein
MELVLQARATAIDLVVLQAATLAIAIRLRPRLLHSAALAFRAGSLTTALVAEVAVAFFAEIAVAFVALLPIALTAAIGRDVGVFRLISHVSSRRFSSARNRVDALLTPH